MTDQVGRVIDNELTISADICRDLFPSANFFSEAKADEISCATVDKITISGREKFRSVIVPGGWYRTNDGGYAKVLRCISVGPDVLPKSTKKRKRENLLADRFNIVECQMYRLEGSRFENTYEVLVSSGPVVMAASDLSRPEHVLRHCTRAGCPGSVVAQGTCTHVEEKVHLVNPFFLK